MSKLFKLKEWLLLSDVAAFLSQALGESVNEADICQLALENRLTLSVCYLNPVFIRRGFLIPISYVKKLGNSFFEDDLSFPTSYGFRIAEEPYLLNFYTDAIEVADGVFDLPMLGGESAVVRAAYLKMAGEEPIDVERIFGAFLRDINTGDYLQLFERLDDAKIEDQNKLTWQPLDSLPALPLLVMRPKLLAAFTDGLAPQKNLKIAISTTEQNSLLKLVIGMAIDGYGYDPTASKSPQPKLISDALMSLGISVSDDTVRKYLKQAVDTVLPGKPHKN